MLLFSDDKPVEMTLPEYRMRRSTRARRMQIKVTPFGEIEVVVPRGLDPALVPVFVARHQAWLEQTLSRVTQLRQASPGLDDALPSYVTLLASNERFEVQYRTQDRGAVRQVDGVLQVGASDKGQVQQSLRRWLSAHARQRLVPMLQECSQALALPFHQVTVRCQKTRWGSCSARKTININRNLLFLPGPLVNYLFVHELCHTVHMNHSGRFWALVAEHVPDFRRFDLDLRSANRFVPRWASPAASR